MLQFPHRLSPSSFELLLSSINVLAQALKHIPLSETRRQLIFHAQLLKSSLFSARIEGNTLTLAQLKTVDLSNPQEKQKKEISNVLKVLSRLETFEWPVSNQTVLSIHAQVLAKLNPHAGQLRAESSAIFDQFGTAVYLTPEPPEMQLMLSQLYDQLQSFPTLSWSEQLLLTASSHYYFEKIHPLLDGNGRTGRVLCHLLLHRTTLFDQFVLPLDQYFDEHRSEYYFHLEKNTRNTEQFAQFFLKAIEWSLEKILSDIKEQSDPSTKNQPTTDIGRQLPRRQEIFYIVQDHPHITFDSIARRFPTIPRRTLAYDVQQLVKQNLLKKLGQTRGVVYCVG